MQDSLGEGVAASVRSTMELVEEDWEEGNSELI